MIDRAKTYVEIEKPDFDEGKVLALGGELVARDDRFLAATYGRGIRPSPRDLRVQARAMVDCAKAFKNVVYADAIASPSSSLTTKPWSEAFIMAVEPERNSKESSYVLTRFHHRYEAKTFFAAACDGHFDFTIHMPERLLVRSNVSRDLIAAIAKAMMNSAGYFAIGARLWATFPGMFNRISQAAFPVHRGLAMGKFAFAPASRAEARQLTFSRKPSGARLVQMPPVFSRFGSAANYVEPDGKPYALHFVGMTYIDEVGMSPTKKPAFEAMLDFGRRHPVINLMGLELLFPGSVSV